MEKSRPKRPIVAFVIMIALALAFYALSFVNFPSLAILPDYGTWMQQCADGNIFAKICYVFSDWGDPTYQKTALGGILMIAGCIIALYTGKKSKCTFGVSYGTGMFFPILAAQLIASAGSVFLYYGIFATEGVSFVPSFIAIASFTPAIVLQYGKEWYKVLTAGVLGVFLGCPFAFFINQHFAAPWGLPGAVAWVTPMIVSGFVAIEVCRFLPWMNKQASDPEVPETVKDAAPALGAPNAPVMNNEWFIKRVFADFTEPVFYGNELAGLLFILGGVISIFLNPANPGYGDGNVYLVIVASQILASAIGIFLYWHRYYELGWYNTFVPVASLTPAFVLFYGTDLYVVVVGAIVGAVFMPPVADWIARSLGGKFHGYIYMGSAGNWKNQVRSGALCINVYTGREKDPNYCANE